MPIVSIIVPVYNAEKYIYNCVLSILHQTVSDTQVILIDDGSTDNSGIICDDFSKIDNRILTLHITNSGVSTARNIGLKYATSQYIMFVDSDDNCEINILEKLIHAIQSDNNDFAMCGYNRILLKPSTKIQINKVNCAPYKGNIKGFLVNSEKYIGIPLLQGPCWKLFKKDIIVNNKITFPEDLDFGEDAMFVYQYLLYVQRVITIDKNLYNYNIYNSYTLNSVFRDNKYEINVRITNKWKELIAYHKISSLDNFYYHLLYTYYVSFIGEMWNCKKINYKSRMYIISRINNMTETLELFDYKLDSSFCIKNNKIKEIDLYFMIKEYIRRKFIFLYKILKR
jgi:glycosyltransferase involved in cell wall biosynthesis